MTEEQWEKTTGFVKMLFAPQVAANARKVRLFGVACCRQVPEWSADERVLAGLNASEEFADGALTDAELWKRREPLNTRMSAILSTRSGRSTKRGRMESHMLMTCLYTMLPDDHLAARHTADRVISGHAASFLTLSRNPRKLLSQLLRDIFGNPFRLVTFSDSWRTGTALSLAKLMYDAREFSAMPILADALQDAGCDNEDILNHCRDANQVHVRGCWVLDLVLGKG